jgi:hypothetical protein
MPGKPRARKRSFSLLLDMILVLSVAERKEAGLGADACLRRLTYAEVGRERGGGFKFTLAMSPQASGDSGETARGTLFTFFTGTNVQILTLRTDF